MCEAGYRPEDWPRRWHQIVAEYNISFERQQNEMRSHFEDRFDQIRKENDEEVSKLRDGRDTCAQRVCDIIDEQAELTESISSLHEELEKIQQEDIGLTKQALILDASIGKTRTAIHHVEARIAEREKEYSNRLLQLEVRKTALRDEIRDLKGFVAMTRRVASVEGGRGSTILATARRRK
jgi:chromosome segregation ATPase